MRSINLETLSEGDRAVVLDRFAGFLNSLTEPIAFQVVDDEREMEALGAIFRTPYKRFFLESPTQIDSLVGALGTRFVRVHESPSVEVGLAGPRHVVDREGWCVQVHNLTRLGGNLSPGFLTKLYDLVHALRIDIEPVEVYRAKSLAKSHAVSVGSRLILRQSEGRTVDQEEQSEFENASSAFRLIGEGKQRLFRTRINLVLRARTPGDLREERTKLKREVGRLLLQTDAPSYLQEALLAGEGSSFTTGRRFYVTTSGALTLFPFSGLDVVDPDGTYLGQNWQTHNAILYDLFEKESYDISIMGMKGFGKSTFIKTYLARLLAQDEEMMVFLFDSIVRPEYAVGPDGSYGSSFAGMTGCRVHRFDRERGAGLDPFAVFPTKRTAANFLASVAKVEDDPDLLADLYLAAERASNVTELVGLATGDLRKRLDANLPPYRFLFEGSMEIFPRMVFVLYDLPPGELRDAAAFLALSAVWKTIQETDKVPISRKKAIVVDEGWSLVEINPRTGRPYFPLAVEYVPEISRTGRHYNTAFVIATQLVSDLMGRGGVYGPGRVIIENCATKVILKQDQAATQVLKEAFDLSDKEEKFIVNAKVGEGILVTPEGRIPFYNFLSDEERRLFTTRPKSLPEFVL
ncbi:MAG: hypothetical protein ABSF83_00645 [Nitrososphaerales archaeon]